MTAPWSGIIAPRHRSPRDRRGLALIGAVTMCLSATASALAQQVSPQSALNYVGRTATVCGRVATATFVENKSVLLAFDQPYPAQSFSAIIRAMDRIKFGTPEMSMPGKRLCVSGPILNAQGRAQMILREPAQITAN